METTANKDLKRGEELMNTYAIVSANKANLQASIKNEIDVYNKHLDEIETELLEIGKRQKKAFNGKGNLEFEKGYLHIKKSGVVLVNRIFDLADFHKSHPEFIKDIKGITGVPKIPVLLASLLKAGEIKKAVVDNVQRKELKQFGVSMKVVEDIEIKVNEPEKKI